jgi:hypothetical protein
MTKEAGCKRKKRKEIVKEKKIQFSLTEVKIIPVELLQQSSAQLSPGYG